MAYLVKCSLCNRDVSSVAKTCPGCGHNVGADQVERVKGGRRKACVINAEKLSLLQ